METTTPNQTLIDAGAATISLDGKDWPVPKLSIKQNRFVVPAMLRVMPIIAESVVIQKTTDDAGNVSEKRVFDLPKLAAKLDEKAMDDLAGITWTALQKGHPKLTRAEFDDMPINMNELVSAIVIIGAQSGMLATKEKSKDGDTTKGNE